MLPHRLLGLFAAAGFALPLLSCSPTSGHARTQDAPAGAATPLPMQTLDLPAGGADFSPELKLLFRVVACGGDTPVPERFDRKVLDEHCAWIEEQLASYRMGYLAKAEPFLAGLHPAGLPGRVVYPFGGGDLLSALTTYPEASEITTLSLEYAGDPRRVDDMDSARLAHSLAQLRRRISGLLAYAESTSENLMQMQRGDIPGQLAFFLIGLRIHGCEPDALRYFRVEADGSLHYLEQKEIAAYEDQRARRLNKVWVAPDFSLAFADSEIVYHREGETRQRVHRHIAADLGNPALTKEPNVLRHLEAKGRVAAMTKAASYLLWGSGFSQVRDYLLGHADLIVSDSTGVPPSAARKAGFTLTTYGTYKGPFLAESAAAANREFLQLWKEQPVRPLDFRYGYPDKSGQHHLLVTRREATRTADQPTS